MKRAIVAVIVTAAAAAFLSACGAGGGTEITKKTTGGSGPSGGESCSTVFGDDCIPEAECEEDSDCGDGFVCRANVCEEAPEAEEPECTTSADCATGYVCTSSGACVKKPSGGGGGGTETYHSMQCPALADRNITGTVGTSLGTRPIVITRGSGSYSVSFKSTTTPPPGITLSGNALMGTPTQAGSFLFKIVASDTEVAGKQVTCSYTLTVTGTISATVAYQQYGTANLHYAKVTVFGAISGGISWSWEDATSACFSASPPSATNTSCGAAASSGSANPVYVTLKNPPADGGTTEIFGSVQSSMATNTWNVSMVLDHLSAGPPETAITSQSLALTIKTAGIKEFWNEYVRTGFSVKFCKDAMMTSDCKSWGPMSPSSSTVDQSFHAGQTDAYTNTTVKLTKEHRYFKLTRATTGFEDYDEDMWILEGLDLTVNYSDGTNYRYYNPCVHRPMGVYESSKFGPDDTAVCAIVSTYNGDSGGTDNHIWLLMKGDDDTADTVDWQSSGSADEGSYYDPTSEHDAGGVLPLWLNWGMDTYNDFEQGDKTSYGVYAFNENPFGSSFKIAKSGEISDTWGLHGYEVYVYRPGQYGSDFQASYSYSKKFQKEDFTDSHLTSTNWIPLQSASGFPPAGIGGYY